MVESLGVLERSRRHVGLSHGELWFRYFSLGGMSSSVEIEAYLYGALSPTAREHDLIALAINERYAELGGDHPVPYAEDGPPS